MFSTSLAVIIPIIILSSSTSPSLSDPRASQVALICSNRTALPANRQAFFTNFLAAMDAVTPQISTLQHARAVEGGSSDDSVYAAGECMRDLSKTDCDLCIATGKTQLLGCLPYQNGTRGGRNYLDGCYLRYDDYKFFGEALSSDDKVVCSREDFNGNRTAFLANIAELVKRLSIEAQKSDGFLETSIEKGNTAVYGLAQCWESVNRSSCSMCLMDASVTISSCTYKQEGRVLNSGCYMRYSINHFYNNSTIDDGGGKGGPNVAVILAVVFSCVAIVMIIMLILFFVRRELAKRRKVSKRLGTLATTLNKSTLNFKYETLEKATNYFDSSNKLGQGGSGTVFKGVLPDGRVVAVKRLFFNTSQWVDQFFNEVNLIRGIDHKNLVKLLGCSITGPESLLVYEYVPNNSLHHYLSDHSTAQMLSWEMRYNIIMGAAEGLAYLHEESQPRIIHRDIKLSNILLDENYTAKIADFGLVRLFPEDKSHISTGVAGTLGYMAPEYFVRGKLTEKADVFSFGVLMIEVVTGRRGNSQTLDPISAVQMVWKLFKSGKSVEAIDPFLEGRFSIEKASRVLHVGLLCAQSSPELRPTMSSVVKMLLVDDEGVIPEPTQPPFLASSTEIMSLQNSGSRNGSSSYHSGSSTTR